MNAAFSEWLNLVLRWIHIIAGISWIGSSFYFIWLDSALEIPKEKNDRLAGSLWMVHSGGFYHVEKRYLGPGEVPPNLHWFKWEAAFTWLSGFSLLVVVYYLGGVMVDAVSEVSPGYAAAIGMGTLIASWFVYDLLWLKLEKKKALASILSFLLLVGVAYALSRVFTGRATYIHVGAVLGTLMVLNVWVRILPAQREMIAATRMGKPRDMTLAARAKGRSVHNNYMTFPVIFVMISNHFPSTYGHEYNWLILAVLALASAGVRHHLNVEKRSTLWLVVLAVIAIFALGYVTS